MEDLDARIHTEIDRINDTPEHQLTADALRAVLNLHQPESTKHKLVRDRWLYCIGCGDMEILPYPCNTVDVIAISLGVKDDL